MNIPAESVDDLLESPAQAVLERETGGRNDAQRGVFYRDARNPAAKRTFWKA